MEKIIYKSNLNRHSIRLKDYDYSKEGMYFITICTQNRECTLSKIEKNVGAGPVSAQVILTDLGKMIEIVYLDLEKEFKNIKLNEFIIMPNHIHGIIEIYKRADTGPAPTIGDVICSLKTRTTHLCAIGVRKGIYKTFNKRIWQRNYYEHIIRNEKEYYQICNYIENNPIQWNEDIYNV